MKLVKYRVINNINIPYDIDKAVACKRGDFIHIVESVVFYNNIYREMKILIATIEVNPHFFEKVESIEGVLIEMPHSEYNFEHDGNTYCKIFYNFRDEVGNIILYLFSITQIIDNGNPIREKKLSVEQILFLERIQKLNDILV